MKRYLFASAAFAAALWTTCALAADKLVISIWGGSWKDLIAQTAAKKFTADTGVEVEFVTGGTIDRLNKAKLAKGSPESDVTFTTSHVGWLYASDGLFETLDVAKAPNMRESGRAGQDQPLSHRHLGLRLHDRAIAPTSRRRASSSTPGPTFGSPSSRASCRHPISTPAI